MSKDTIKSLKKQNDELKAEIECIRKDFKKLEQDAKISEARSTQNDDSGSTPDKETLKSLEYLSNEYDDVRRSQSSAKQRFSKFESRLNVLEEKVEGLSKSIVEMEEYSYAYNVKLVGIPEHNPKETAMETSALCVKIFNAMGAKVSIPDIDIAHRVQPRRNNGGRARPIVCKFVRRLAREQVMAVRRNMRSVDPRQVNLPPETSLNQAGVYDHLTPRRQKLFADAKSFKVNNNFKFCWTKNAMIYLRKSEDSPPIKVNDQRDLELLTNSSTESVLINS